MIKEKIVELLQERLPLNPYNGDLADKILTLLRSSVPVGSIGEIDYSYEDKAFNAGRLSYRAELMRILE